MKNLNQSSSANSNVTIKPIDHSYQEDRCTFASNQVSARVIRNNIKGLWLEDPVGTILENTKVLFEDTSNVFNFKNKRGEGVPDFIIKEHIILELKNWDCLRYTVDFSKALHEILYRFLNYWKNRKILIISNPKWSKGVKGWLLACGIEVYEVGEFITSDIFKDNEKGIRLHNKLVSIIKQILGYVYSSNRSYHSINRSVFYSAVSYCNSTDCASKRSNAFKTRLKDDNFASNTQSVSGLPRSQNNEIESTEVSDPIPGICTELVRLVKHTIPGIVHTTNQASSTYTPGMHPSEEENKDEYDKSLQMTFPWHGKPKFIRLNEKINKLTPSCKNCNKGLRGYCCKTGLDRIKCLKSRVYLFNRSDEYHYFNVNRRSYWFVDAIELFWYNIKREEEKACKIEANTLKDPKYEISSLDCYMEGDVNG